MNYSRPLFVLGLALVALVIVMNAMLTPPEERWFSRTQEAARSYPDKVRTTGEGPDMEAVRRAAEAQWELGEYYLRRGEYDSAAMEYQRLIDQFPYTELDYGYRSDDARKRLREIAERRAEPGR